MSTRRPLSRSARVRRFVAGPTGQKLSHRIPALAVFAVAAYQSYWHTVEVALRAGESSVTAHIMPASVDGMMMVAARYISHAKTRAGKGIAASAFVVGTFATLAANVMAAQPNLFSRVVAGWPAGSLVFTAAILHWGEMRAKPARRPARATAPATKPGPGRLKAVG